MSVNITTHDSSPGFVVDGRGSFTHNGVYNRRKIGNARPLKSLISTVSFSTFYSTGPAAPNILAQPDGVIYSSRNTFFAGGNRSPNIEVRRDADVFCEGCLMHTSGAGSPLALVANSTLGLRYTSGSADASPIVILDGNSTITLDTAHVTSHSAVLGGIVAFDSGFNMINYASVALVDTWLVVTHPNAPAIQVGNTQVTITLNRSHVEARSGVLLLVGNDSLAWPLDRTGLYSTAGSARDAATGIRPGIVTASLSNADVRGDITARDGARVLWQLVEWASWAGATSASNAGKVSVELAPGCRWALTGHSKVHEIYGVSQSCTQNSTTSTTQSTSSSCSDSGLPMTTFPGSLPELDNIFGNGYNLYYLKTAPRNAWLNGKQYALRNGGLIMPYSGESERALDGKETWGGSISEAQKWVWPALTTHNREFRSD